MHPAHRRPSNTPTPSLCVALPLKSPSLSFNQLHRECRTRIQQKKWCPTCQTEVTNDAIVKGYEFEKGKYALIEEDDMAKVRPESTRVINIVQFTDAKVIDPVYVERPYYLGPDGQVAADAFAVMRDGMAGKAAIGKLALYGRESPCAMPPKCGRWGRLTS